MLGTWGVKGMEAVSYEKKQMANVGRLSRVPQQDLLIKVHLNRSLKG